MQSLLRWSIENSEPRDESSSGERPEPKEIDPAILETILGRPDPELMKEALAIAMNEEKDEEARLTALDDFEMLIEQIDNANNIEKMRMWTPLQRLLISSSTSDEIRSAVLWIIGTAAQNNPAAQVAYLSLPDSPLSSILGYLSPNESSSATRSKAVYALSGLLKHNAKGVKVLDEVDGWNIFKTALGDPDISVRRKTVFLLNSLLLPSSSRNAPTTASDAQMHGADISEPPQDSDPVHPNSHASMTPESTATSKVTALALREHGLIEVLLQGLVSPVPYGKDGDMDGDADLEEKLVRLLFTYLTTAGGTLENREKDLLREWLQGRSDRVNQWDLGKDELDALQHALA